MSKRKWYAKAIYLVFALALVVGLSVTPVAANGPTLVKTIKTADGVAVSATNPMSGIVDFQFDYTSLTGTANADSLILQVAGPGPYTANPINMWFYFPGGVPSWDAESEIAMMEMGFVDSDGDGDLEDEGILAAYEADDGTTGCSFTIAFSLDTTKNWSADTDDLSYLTGISGAWNRPIHSSVWPNTCPSVTTPYHIMAQVYAGGASGTPLLTVALEQDDYLYNDPYVWPTLAKDVKSGKQIFALKGALTGEECAGCGPVTWEFRPGQGLSGVGQPGSGEDIIVQRIFDNGAWSVPTESDILGGLSSAEAVEVCSIQVGEVHGYANNVPVYTGGDITLPENWECVDGLNGEKKWGEIERTELTAWTDTPCAQRPVGAETEISRVIDLGGAATEDVLVQELVIANFLPGPVPAPAGDAKITWWLLENDVDDECQDALEELIARFDNYDYASGELGWGEGCGRYAEWAASPDPDFIPYDIIEDIYATCAASDTLFTMRECVDDITGAGTTKTLTHTDGLGDPLGEGYTNVNVEFSEVGTTGFAEPVIVVVLAEYDTNYNGENPVCVEYIKFKPTKVIIPEVCQVKTPQVRWAGEKIVLEKDWGPDAAMALVGFFLEEGTIGNMIPLNDTTSWASEDARTVFTMCDCSGVARAMFETEQQGQVDIKCVLYGSMEAVGDLDSFNEILMYESELDVIGNHGFLVYYLALEDVTVDEALSDLEGIEAGEGADVLVKVRGWFTSDALPGTSRGPVLGEDGITYVRPAGRYILPDDWAALAGSDEATSSMYSRPQYDLMNTVGAGVTSTDEWGPFDDDVRTTTPPGEADDPVIGPFNTLQPWNCVDVDGNPTNMWIADDLVPADYKVAAPTVTAPVVLAIPSNDWTGVDLRNTVVPDTTIDWYDCPMPQALVTFELSDDTILIELDKGDSLGYGVDGAGNYMAPFYGMEIPTHWLIPVGGYRWDSWGLWTGSAADDGPYDFWADLGITPDDDDVLEVYCDNHGYAGVTIDGEDMAEPDCVTLDVIADFPVMACKYPAVDTEQRVCWGIELEHLNADFEVSDRVDGAPKTISFYGLKGAGTGAPWTSGGTQPYVKAEWDFDGNGTIDATIEGATSAVTLATQPFEFTAGGSYSPWLRVTDTNGLVDICEKPDYIVLTGAAGYAACDINMDGDVDPEDFLLFAGSYGLWPEDPGYVERCNLDTSTDDIGILDFLAFATCYMAEA